MNIKTHPDYIETFKDYLGYSENPKSLPKKVQQVYIKAFIKFLYRHKAYKAFAYNFHNYTRILYANNIERVRSAYPISFIKEAFNLSMNPMRPINKTWFVLDALWEMEIKALEMLEIKGLQQMKNFS